MPSFCRLVFSLVLMAVIPAWCAAQDRGIDDSKKPDLEAFLRKYDLNILADLPRDYDWEKIARKYDLGDMEIEQLRRDKFVIAGRPLLQSFSVYVGGGSDLPFFITTDALLNGFHVLFEESIFQLEKPQARRLPDILNYIASNLDKAAEKLEGNPALREAARKRAHIVIGAAWALLDDKALPRDPALRQLVQEEVKRITAAEKQLLPAWMGPPTDDLVAIDYTRFQPRGIYTRKPELERYFRAVSWLQAIPFRLENDEEFAAFCLLRLAAGDDLGALRGQQAIFWQAFHQLLGTPDSWDLWTLDSLPESLASKHLAIARDTYRKQAAQHFQLNEQLQKNGKPILAFRFVSAFALPDAVLMRQTVLADPGGPGLPSGLEVCAALGSPFARTKLARERPLVAQKIDDCQPLFKRGQLYAEYLRCLGTLLRGAEADAPAFMHNQAWQAKTCQTALGSWAQMRHTWALQAKQNYMTIGGNLKPAGFVEPVPEFYRQLARLVDKTNAALKVTGALDIVHQERAIIEELRTAKAIFDKATKENRGFSTLSGKEKEVLIRFDPGLKYSGTDAKRGDSFGMIPIILCVCADFEKEGFSPRSYFDIGLGIDDLGRHWRDLHDLCKQLELLAHKQLRKVAFAEEEHAVIRSFGERLAAIMLYGGHAFRDPRDDAPRIVDVFTNPGANKHLLVGIARPRQIWVLYPYRGVDMLCRGSVLPYHEFAHPTRLTDDAWRGLLDSPNRPAAPAWLAPLMSN